MPTKVDTIPLLSPTMESELLKEPWAYTQSKVNVTTEEENTASSTWEENFQDLSSWCMDTFQGQCDFHIGESSTFKVSGTKYEGNCVLSSEEGVLKDLTSVTDEEKWSIKMNTAETTKYTGDNCRGIQSISEQTKEYGNDDSTSDTNNSLQSKIPKGTVTVTSTICGNKQNGIDANTPFNPKYHAHNLDLDDACPISVDSAESQREMWDVLRTVETTGSDTFDLLSYLCDDEMRSPEGSVSTDSSTVSKLWPATSSSLTTPQTSSVKAKTERDGSIRRKMESRTTSTITSSSIDTPVVSSRRSERTRAPVISKVESTYTKTKRERQGGRKRYIESDSDDWMSTSNYRESREKNNEASRKSRMNKKAKETEMAMRAVELERDNRILKMKVEELEKLVTSMRSALLRSALKKEF